MSKKDEVMKRCLVCGKIYCYSPVLIDSLKTAKLIGIGNALHGLTRKDPFNTNTIAMTTNWANVLNVMEQVKCPNCGSLKSEPFEGDANIEDISGPVQVSINPNATEENLIERIEDFIEEKEWAKARVYCDHVLDLSPHNGYVYLMKCMVLHKASIEDELVKIKDLSQDTNINKALRYADDALRDKIMRIDGLSKKLDQEVIFQEESAKYNRKKGKLILTRRKLEFCSNTDSIIFELSQMSDVSAKENMNYAGVKFGRIIPNCVFFNYNNQNQWIFCKSGSASQLAALISEHV